MDAIRASGKLFLDREFPPTINSIGELNYFELPVHWIRAKVFILHSEKGRFV